MTEVPADVVHRLRSLCLSFPDVVEEAAWIGIRWSVRRRMFAHVLVVDAGHPPAYARAAGTDGPAILLTFRADGPELEALRRQGPPFFAPPWHPSVVGVRLDDAGPDVMELSELLTESYCSVAPLRLVTLVARPDG